jgi:hypothetical protein
VGFFKKKVDRRVIKNHQFPVLGGVSPRLKGNKEVKPTFQGSKVTKRKAKIKVSSKTFSNPYSKEKTSKSKSRKRSKPPGNNPVGFNQVFELRM